MALLLTGSALRRIADAFLMGSPAVSLAAAGGGCVRFCKGRGLGGENVLGLSVTPLYVLEVAKVKQPATIRTQSVPLPKKKRTSKTASGMTAVAAASRPSAARCSRSGSFFGDSGNGQHKGWCVC
jgi:hypothetical protein